MRVVSAESFATASDYVRCNEIERAFLDAYKSDLAVLILDDIDQVRTAVRSGPGWVSVWMAVAGVWGGEVGGANCGLASYLTRLAHSSGFYFFLTCL